MPSPHELVFFVGFVAAFMGSCAAPALAYPWLGPVATNRVYWPAMQRRSGIPTSVAAVGFIAMAFTSELVWFAAASAVAGVLLVVGLRLPRAVRHRAPSAERERHRRLVGRHAVPWQPPGPGLTSRVVVLGCGYVVGWAGILVAVGVLSATASG